MKTALELLGDDDCTEAECKDVEYGWCHHEMQLIAQRAREEMRSACLEIVETYEPRREDADGSSWSREGALTAVAARISKLAVS